MWMPIRYEFWQQINWRETFTAKTAMWRQNSLYICRKNEPVLRPVYSRSHDGRAVCSHHWGLKTVSFLIARQDFHRSTFARPTIYRPSRVSSSDKRDWRWRPITVDMTAIPHAESIWSLTSWAWPLLDLKMTPTNIKKNLHPFCLNPSSYFLQMQIEFWGHKNCNE